MGCYAQPLVRYIRMQDLLVEVLPSPAFAICRDGGNVV